MGLKNHLLVAVRRATRKDHLRQKKMKLAILFLWMGIVASDVQVIFHCPNGYTYIGMNSLNTLYIQESYVHVGACCPLSAPELHDNGSGRLFCCPRGSGSHCTGTHCNCRQAGNIRYPLLPKATYKILSGTTTKQTCSGPPNRRQACAVGGVTRQTCLNRGCCYDESVRNVPWCFYKS